MSLSYEALHAVRVARKQREESHAEARKLGYGFAVDAVEMFVPRDDEEIAIVIAVRVRWADADRHGDATVRVEAWIGDMVHGNEHALPPIRLLGMKRADVIDMVRMNVERALLKVGEVILNERLAYVPPFIEVTSNMNPQKSLPLDGRGKRYELTRDVTVDKESLDRFRADGGVIETNGFTMHVQEPK